MHTYLFSLEFSPDKKASRLCYSKQRNRPYAAAASPIAALERFHKPLSTLQFACADLIGIEPQGPELGIPVPRCHAGRH